MLSDWQRKLLSTMWFTTMLGAGQVMAEPGYTPTESHILQFWLAVIAIHALPYGLITLVVALLLRKASSGVRAAVAVGVCAVWTVLFWLSGLGITALAVIFLMIAGRTM